jgi:hypothetical protein
MCMARASCCLRWSTGDTIRSWRIPSLAHHRARDQYWPGTGFDSHPVANRMARLKSMSIWNSAHGQPPTQVPPCPGSLQSRRRVKPARRPFAIRPAAWTLKAFKYYCIPAPPVGFAGIVVEPTEDLHRLQDELTLAVKPFTVKSGIPAAFFSEEGGRDVQKSLISYVANFVTDAAGKHFNPHVTIGVGAERHLNKMLSEPFQSFTFSAAGASVYQLGTFGTARKELMALTMTP